MYHAHTKRSKVKYWRDIRIRVPQVPLGPLGDVSPIPLEVTSVY